MQVLITGGGGFIGSHLVESQLEKGHRVRVVDLDLTRILHLKEHPKVEMVKGDISDPGLVKEVMAGAEMVYHLASTHLQTRVPEAQYWAVNVEAVENLLRTARTAGVRRFLHCSSVGVYGVITEPPADEVTATNPVNVYERTKLAGEQKALRFAAETGFPLTVVRPAWVYGPRCPRTQKLFRAAETGRFVMIGPGRTRRQPLYVADAVAGFEICAESNGKTGKVYVLAGAEEITIEALVRKIFEVVGVRPTIVKIPTLMAETAGLAIELGFRLLATPPPLSRRNLEFFTRDNAFNIRKARHELGFEPSVGLAQGLKAAWECFKAQKAGDTPG